MHIRFTFLICFLLLLSGFSTGAERTAGQEEQTSPFATDVAPFLTKYCVGCHNSSEPEAGLELDTIAGIQAGSDQGPIILPHQAEESILIQVINGTAEPKMPPEDEPQPTAAELTKLKKWIEDGAKIESGESMRPSRLVVPSIEAAKIKAPKTAMAWSPTEDLVAEASFQSVTLNWISQEKSETLPFTAPGKINSLRFTADGKSLIVASGIAGLKGTAIIWDLESKQVAAKFEGHRDTLYAAVSSPDGKWLATAGYDQVIRIWDFETQSTRHELTGHNDAIYDLAFDPTSQVLASASGDETVKVWRVKDGLRLDTMGQPTAEQFGCRITPNGQHVIGVGGDKRIRVWRLESLPSPQINPLQVARFGHEGAITHLALSQDGSLLVTASEDKTLKVWETATWSEVQLLEPQSDIIASIAFSPEGKRLRVALMNGEINSYEIEPTLLGSRDQPELNSSQVVSVIRGPAKSFAESEPNNSTSTATEIMLPATITGTIEAEPNLSENTRLAEDLFRFQANAGEQWIFEIDAARSGSKLDSQLEILDDTGEPVLRVLLQAVRDSYFTFRGKNSDTSDDFRVFNWQEMELNELLYSDGEVVKLWMYPRGPDSGYKVYPGYGKRYAMFDTTAVAHALQAPCYVVTPLAPGSEIVPTGLPVFPIYFENDDESTRRLGKDSKLTFTAPRSGHYYVRVRDTRGFSGADFKYTLHCRAPRPDFSVRLSGFNNTVHPGAGREFTVEATRKDGFSGAINVEVTGLPPGFHVSSPLTIEAGQNRAVGVVWADANAHAPTEENKNRTKVTAKADIGGTWVSYDIGSLGAIQLGEQSKMIVPSIHVSQADGSTRPGTSLQTLKIKPGETVSALVKVNRHGFAADLALGKEESGRNLPHGLFVDNIGLNGLLIPASQNEQVFFITAASWVKPQKRLFHLKTNAQGGQCSVPVWIEVVTED